MNTPRPTRCFNWVSALDPKAQASILELANAMRRFYSESPDYYEDIAFATANWEKPEALVHHDILRRLKGFRILEVGCGAAAVLSTGRIDQRHYCGCDFSSARLRVNGERWPDARFVQLTSDRELPFNNGEFDTVFSVFVIEHAVFPHRLLKECARVLRSNGVFLLVCPDFLGRGRMGRMTSQRLGLSAGTGREKLARGQILDAVITAWDSRVRMPLACLWRRWKASSRPQFYLNLSPVCFTDPFIPDVDAVYLTSAQEMISYLSNEIEFAQVDAKVAVYASKMNLIFLAGRKL